MRFSKSIIAVAAYFIALPAMAAAPGISQVSFGLITNPQTVTLTGSGFLSSTTVKLSNSTNNLIVASYSTTSLKANLPSGLVAGVYTLTAANGSSSVAWYVTYGATGPTGAATTVTVGATTTGAAGTNASVTNSGTSSAAVLNFTVPRGATGATGPAGPTGSQGVPGAMGATGSVGPAGPTGAVGSQGIQGIQGIQGFKGDTGAAGTTGIFSGNGTAIGSNALNFGLGGGDNNTAFGYYAMAGCAPCGSSSAFGVGALQNNKSGSNSAFGMAALSQTTTGGNNAAFGADVMPLNKTGNSNSALGVNALLQNDSGSMNTAVGMFSLRYNMLGSGNIGIGFSGGANLTGDNNIAIGTSGVSSESNTIRIGEASHARTYITGINGNDLSATGLPVVVTPSGQLGTGALLAGPVGPAGPAGPAGAPGSVGPAGANGSAGPAGAAGTNGSPGANGAQGVQGVKGDKGDPGTGEVFKDAIDNVAVSGQNAALGALAGGVAGSSGDRNNAFGSGALGKNLGGRQNNAFGYVTMLENVSGNYNDAFGTAALQYNQSGSENTAIGGGALYFSTGNSNTALGFGAGSITSGNGNIFIGNRSGSLLSSGDNNVYIGSSGGPPQESNVVRIGEDQSKIYLPSVLNYGGDNQAAWDLRMTASGRLFVLASSERYKEDIEPMANKTDRLYQLRPVTFRYKPTVASGTIKDTQYGLIAEEVEKVLPEIVIRGSDGKIESVAYSALVPMLLNELQRNHQQLQAEHQELVRLQSQIAEVEVLKARLIKLERLAMPMTASDQR